MEKKEYYGLLLIAILYIGSCGLYFVATILAFFEYRAIYYSLEIDVMKKEKKHRKWKLLFCFWFLFLLENITFFLFYNTFWSEAEFVAFLKKRSCGHYFFYARIFYYFGVYVIFLFALFITRYYHCDRLSSKTFNNVGLVILFAFGFLLCLLVYYTFLPLVFYSYEY